MILKSVKNKFSNQEKKIKKNDSESPIVRRHEVENKKDMPKWE